MKIFIIAAISLDGFIAQERDQVSTDWTSKADRQFFRDRTKQAGAMVMGRTTYETIGRPLPGRLNIAMSSKGDSTLNIPVEGRDKAPLVTSATPEEIVTAVQAAGYKELAICGGASVYSQFLEKKLVDTLYITVEPVIFGSGIKLFSNLSHDISLELVSQQPMGESGVLLSYEL